MKYVVVDLEMNRLANKFAEEKAVCGELFNFAEFDISA